MDVCPVLCNGDFYPRPPRGGRPVGCIERDVDVDFYPRPPRGGRQAYYDALDAEDAISIHALREEGDRQVCKFFYQGKRFLSTPSARRATLPRWVQQPAGEISIHALREEGDPDGQPRHLRRQISIHALREEGDAAGGCSECVQKNFYPRPPRGGRLRQPASSFLSLQFLSTPSARRATARRCDPACVRPISIHALREEGDRLIALPLLCLSLFLSTPSARRATRD